jgi:hypothetical protein
MLCFRVNKNNQRRIVAYLDGLYLGGHLRQAKVNALPAHAFGRLQSASGGATCEAPAFWAPSGVDIVPERSEWDAVHWIGFEESADGK